MEWSSFDLIRSVVALARSAEVDWTGLSLLDTWFPYVWDPCEVFDLCQGHTSVSGRHPLDNNVILSFKPLTARSVCFGVGQMLSMDEARARVLGPEAAPGSASVTMGGD